MTCCVMFILLIPVVWTALAGMWGAVLYGAIIAETGLCAVLLSSHRTLSLRALRWCEICLMGSLILYFAWEQVQLFQGGILTALAGHGRIGPIVAARSVSWMWALTMIIYAVWIPNTMLRAVIVVAVMLVGFLTVTLGLAMASTSLPTSELAAFVLYSTTHMGFPAAIAIFGAYRIQTLQRAVSEARQLGPYRLIRRLGAGGMGEVFQAQHALLKRPCALKLIRAEYSADERSVSRFEREVQAMSTLTHPNTVRIYDYGVAGDGTFYYAMEYLPGLSLQDLGTRHGPLPPGRVVYLVRQVCEALREAHSVGLIHRDIKPANILASQIGGEFDVAKLLDFGLVRVHNIDAGMNSLTGVDAIAGTPAFMSPEQAGGATKIDERSDIYSLGAVTYFLLTGRPPFARPTSVETMAAHLSDAVEPPRGRCPEIPVDLEQVVLRCLGKKPEARFADVAALEEALAACACGDAWSSERAAEWWRAEDVGSTGLM
jgi:serine/threonine-protein kinase